METAIKKAIEGGWKPEYKDHKMKKAYKRSGSWMEKGNTSSFLDWKNALLDPLFWQCLGKAEGWTRRGIEPFIERGIQSGIYAMTEGNTMPGWKWQWHRFIDHLAEGKDAESFFKELLK